MIAETNSAYDYHIGGSLPLDAPTYVRRKADEELYLGVLAGRFCYVLNSRQMGKSSLRVRTMQRLRESGIACAAIDITAIGTRDISPEQWYAGIIDSIVSSLELFDSFDLEEWWINHSRLSNIKRFSKFIEEVLLKLIPQNLVIFVDEIDSILRLNFNIDDFFAFIRKFYNSRADNPDYRRLTFALIGVATPSDLIQNKRCTPFNVGRAIELSGFQLQEAQPLALGLTKVASNPQTLLQAVLDWTGGQPFLTQKVCQLIRLADSPISTGSEQEWVENLVRSRLIHNWEAQDEPEHLRTIRSRLLQSERRTVKLLGLYQQILQQGEIVANDSPEQMELRLSGLVVKQDGKLKVHNRIYQSIFQLDWVEEELCNLRPYAKQLAAWEASNRQDESHLLCGQELQDALAWTADKSLSDQDYQFLTVSQQKANEILNQIVWELVSPLSVDEVSPKVESLLKRLQQVSGDDSLTLLKIKAGSTILVLQGSQEAFERIRTLFGTGQLNELLGIPIQDVRYAADAIDLTPRLCLQPVAEPELPMGQVELASAFYVERPGIDEHCYEAITQPGSLIRIQAPRQMGKTSLMAQILHRASALEYATVPLSFQLADSKIFTDLDQFLRWFCASVALELQLPDRLADYWNEIFGSKVNCKSYFERYLLANVTTPLALGLDEVDRVFEYPELAADFFGLLRAWHEEAKNREIWRKLRLVVVHSTEAYISMDINHSPFNVGSPVELPEFKSEQVQELARRHGLAWGATEVGKLMAMVGGHPYLVQLALHHIARQKITLSELLVTAPTDAKLYSDHLRRHLGNLEQHPQLATALKEVVTTDSPVQLESMERFKLHSMGLVHLRGNEVTPRCDLYRQYFRVRLLPSL